MAEFRAYCAGRLTVTLKWAVINIAKKKDQYVYKNSCDLLQFVTNVIKEDCCNACNVQFCADALWIVKEDQQLQISSQGVLKVKGVWVTKLYEIILLSVTKMQPSAICNIQPFP